MKPQIWMKLRGTEGMCLASAYHNFKWVIICLIWNQTFGNRDVTPLTAKLFNLNFHPLEVMLCLADALHNFKWGVKGGGPGVVVSTAAFHASVRGSLPGLGGLKET